MSPARAATIGERVTAADWPGVHHGLDELGAASIGTLLDREQCAELIDGYGDDRRFSSTIDMAQHRFGDGQYRYFAHPLPDTVAQLRAALWPQLLPVARRWAERLDRPAPWPDRLEDWLARCHEAGQTRPTPLILRYGGGDWNALHRDLYGELVFPLQVVIGLDVPDEDYQGGELVLVEQRPRAQSRATVWRLARGEAVVLTTSDRPVPSARGWSAAPMRHGVSVVRSGHRHTLGVIFHDAK
jgi:hypothetical protein